MTAIDGIAAHGPEMRLPNAYATPPAFPTQLRQSDTRQADTGDGKFGFADFIDVINPLQHIPGVAEVYRAVTHDQISDQARKTGNTLYGIVLGGPVGLGAMLAYNALGDRIGGTNETPAPTTEQKSIAKTGLPDHQKTGGVGARQLQDGVAVPKDVNAGVSSVLGHKIASTGTIETGSPLDLVEVLGHAAVSTDPALKTPVSTLGVQSAKASSVNYTELSEDPDTQHPVMPDEIGLDRLATHKSNHLPLDVLKVMQERHAQRTTSQQS